MITPEMYQIFDWSESNRRLHYGRLNNACMQMTDLIIILRGAQAETGFLDIAVRDREEEFWMALTRPGMKAQEQTGYRRIDLDLVEYLIEWAAGVKHHATAELMEMDARYPELRQLKGSELMPAKMVYRRIRPLNWLKRVLRSMF